MRNHHSRRRSAGFTLIELMCTVAAVGVLSSIAYPSYQGVMHKVRRSDGRMSLLMVQLAQERFRSEHPGYSSSLADIGMAARSMSGHYTLAVASASEASFQADAVALGPQASDTRCRYLRLTVQGGNPTYASGSDGTVANADAANRSCWSL
jgi:type IV pilus assembly protein PilE